jgi:ubiquinone/menaquinone biosynthesis C-methylase UbiE
VKDVGETVLRKLYPLHARLWYPLTSRYLSGADAIFINWGYEENPPLALPLEAADEPHRYAIALYHQTATQVELAGKQVLEVSCGHGGGASYLMRTFGPASYTGLDLNRAGINFCRRRHRLSGLEFVCGDAEDLPFSDESFDVVINIEASHCYPHFDKFLDEVARVLRPSGDFLYADVRPRNFIATWEQELGAAPLRIVSVTDISEQVARGLEKNMPQLRTLSRRVPVRLVNKVYEAARRGLQEGGDSYRIYHLAKAT